MKPDLPELKHVIIVDHGKQPQLAAGRALRGTTSWTARRTSTRSCRTVPRRSGDHALHLRHDGQVEGRGARPPGRAGPLRHGQVRARPPPRDDIYWCTADPGWVTGTSYGMFAPHTNGVTSVIYEGGFSASKWYERHPAAQGDGLVHGADGDPPADEGRRRDRRSSYDLSSPALHDVGRRAAEPRGRRLGRAASIGLPFHDNWWQTETGSIMIANYPSCRSSRAAWASRCPASSRASSTSRAT